MKGNGNNGQEVEGNEYNSREVGQMEGIENNGDEEVVGQMEGIENNVHVENNLSVVGDFRKNKRARRILSEKKSILFDFYDYEVELFRTKATEEVESDNIIVSVPITDDQTTEEGPCGIKFIQNNEEHIQDTEQARNQLRKTITSFITQYNETEIHVSGNLVDEKSIYKWIKADERFEFEDWGGLNDLDKPNCRKWIVLEVINSALLKAHPDAGKLQQVVRSGFYPDQHGVLAKVNIPSGEILGFFQGDLVMQKSSSRGHFKYYGLTDATQSEHDPESGHIDGSAFDSCYARYYLCSPDYTLQNVAVVRLPNWIDHNRAICFVAIKDIKASDELLIAMDQDYARNRSKRIAIALPSISDEIIALKASKFGK
jgi:hypothetical protein